MIRTFTFSVLCDCACLAFLPAPLLPTLRGGQPAGQRGTQSTCGPRTAQRNNGNPKSICSLLCLTHINSMLHFGKRAERHKVCHYLSRVEISNIWSGNLLSGDSGEREPNSRRMGEASEAKTCLPWMTLCAATPQTPFLQNHHQTLTKLQCPVFLCFALLFLAQEGWHHSFGTPLACPTSPKEVDWFLSVILALAGLPNDAVWTGSPQCEDQTNKNYVRYMS